MTRKGSSTRTVRATAAVVWGALFALGCGGEHGSGGDAGPDSTPPGEGGPHVAPDSSVPPGKIEHVVLIMQENRSFDHYFGMFPGADGFTLDAKGQPTNTNPDPKLGGKRVKAFHAAQNANSGGSHDHNGFVTCFNGGKMDGFIANAETSSMGCADPESPTCTNGKLLDAMGYKTGADIPNYWAYAKAFTLQDHLFEDVASWSWPEHQFIVSAWAADCTSADAMSCANRTNDDEAPASAGVFAWTPITYLLDRSSVSWKYYLSEGTAPDCPRGESECPPVRVQIGVPSIWNPLPFFEVVKAANEQTTNVVALDQFYKDVLAGALPAVSWIAPSHKVSEHPPSSVAVGQAFTTGLINTIMRHPAIWSNTVIFLFWDDWGGFYDHVPPVAADANGYGFRTPGLIISPWVKPGHIDHQHATFDAYLKFIEDVLLGGQRLDAKTDGRPDSRPDVRENLPQTGDLRLDFDFEQKPNPPLVLSEF